MKAALYSQIAQPRCSQPHLVIIQILLHEYSTDLLPGDRGIKVLQLRFQFMFILFVPHGRRRA